jgi:hypothetical protein
VERLVDTVWSFFVFFSQEGIFMALALWRRLRWCMWERRQRAPAYKSWEATARPGPSAITINADAEAQAASLESAASA